MYVLLGWHKVFGLFSQVAVDCKMTMDVEDYATSFRPDIIDAVSGWCQGATFAKVLTLTDVFEVRLRVWGHLAGFPFEPCLGFYICLNSMQNMKRMLSQCFCTYCWSVCIPC